MFGGGAASPAPTLKTTSPQRASELAGQLERVQAVLERARDEATRLRQEKATLVGGCKPCPLCTPGSISPTSMMSRILSHSMTWGSPTAGGGGSSTGAEPGGRAGAGAGPRGRAGAGAGPAGWAGGAAESRGGTRAVAGPAVLQPGAGGRRPVPAPGGETPPRPLVPPTSSGAPNLLHSPPVMAPCPSSPLASSLQGSWGPRPLGSLSTGVQAARMPGFPRLGRVGRGLATFHEPVPRQQSSGQPRPRQSWRRPRLKPSAWALSWMRPGLSVTRHSWR